MRFDRVDTDEIAQPGISAAAAQVFAEDIRGTWVSNCHRVILIIKHWTTVQSNDGRPQAAVEVYAGDGNGVTDFVAGIKCKIDGSAAFVAKEVMASLADYEFDGPRGEFVLLQRMVNLRTALTDGGKEMVTLPRYHKYMERKGQ